MRITLSILLFLPYLNCLSQRITDTSFYDNTDRLRSYGVYDTNNKYWRLYKFYPDGKLEQTEKLNPVTFFDNDTSFAYHPNGKIAWIFPYTDSGFLTGRLTGYYENGLIMRESYYYRQFRTGTWKEYYPNGQIKSVSHFEISKEDSVFYRGLTSEDYQNGFAEPDSFSWGEHDSLRIGNTLFLGQTKTEFTTLISKKTGVWKTYDSTGKLICRKNYNKLK
jgi:antitoxin component YwqK of YwqJK toxin-antitoxin module